MSALFPSFTRLFQDPPPEFVFEVAPDAVRMARASDSTSIKTELLTPGIVSPSPLHDNIAIPEPLNEAVARLASGLARGKRRTAAVLLPDHCAHIAILDFDSLPEKADEQVSLVRFRVKRSVPFDLDSAAVSYWIQPAVSARTRREVLVAVAAADIVRRYEAPFILAGFHPGLVTFSLLASLDLVPAKGTMAFARLSGSVITIAARQQETVKVVRSIQLSDGSLAEIADHLHQTLVFIEDNVGASAGELFLCGFGALEAEAMRDFPTEFQIPVRPLGGSDTGIRGYLKGITA